MDQDISLMLQIKEDNLEAFEELYNKYRRPIANFFFRLGCDREISEDYTQEVFIRLWRARKGYRPRAKLTTYLFQIAKNYWLNQKDKLRRRPYLYHIEYRASDQAPSLIEGLQDAKLSPQEHALETELQRQIQAAIAALPEKQRLVFVLSEIQGFKYREIAEILEIPIGTVKSRMVIAESKLRDKLRAYIDQGE